LNSIGAKAMKVSRIAMCILLMMWIFAGAVSIVNGECTACKGGSPTAQQDVLNNEWAVFLGKENVAAEVMTSTGGLVTPRYNRENNPSLQAKNGTDLIAKQATDQNHSTAGTALPSQAEGSDVIAKRSSSFASMLASFDSINDSDIILDISPNATEYIPGSINIPYTQFLENGGILKSASKVARILGDAGISQNDALKIAGECQPCGGGPAAAGYGYAVMKYVGHKDVMMLDGSIDDWVKQGRPTTSKPIVLPPKNYIAAIDANLMATYDFVHSAAPQIIDARAPVEYDAAAIPGAINIPYDRVLVGKRIKDESSLKELFSSIQKDKPVVVYTNTGVKASMVWFALGLLGYDAKIYTWQDWQANLPRLNIALQEKKAQPNPAKIGDVVQITVVFMEKNQNAGIEPQSKIGNQSGNESILTIKGCATCGFGSPQGYADLNSTDGVVKIGSTPQAQKSAAEKGFTVSARILSPSGDSVSRVVMKRIKSDGDEFAGIWNANVAAGVYRVDIVATLGEITETYPDVMQIEVVQTSKYKNLGNE
jgi:thiosulfate/3-mercaptopyruvate sulfurtransferase